MKSPVVLYSCLFDDVKRLEPGVKGLDRDIITIKSRFEHEGFGFLSKTLSSLGDAFDIGISTGCFTCPSSFSKKEALPKFLSGLLCKVFDIKTGHLLKTPLISVIKLVREILRLFKKVKLSPKDEEKLHSEAVLKFVETDNLLSDVSFDKSKLNLLRSVCRLVLPNLDGFDSRNLNYKHGPGGVAEKVKSNQKWVLLEDILASDDNLRSSLGYGSFSFHDDSPIAEPTFPSLHLCNEARLVTVPKDSTSRRTITVEPLIKQFIQQGLNTYIRDSILKCGILSRCLALKDQSANQALALEGSIHDNYATIDLSSASDLLSLELVKVVFAERPHFLSWALDSRSEYCDLGKTKIKMLKFAGMGNALTFPVQSIVFALLAICGVLCTEGKRPSYGNVRAAAKKVQVFGDDIIVNKDSAHQVVDWITSFGLKVNQKKSFLEGNFKESCGLDAFAGVLVTPTYLRVNPVFSERNPNDISSLVSTCNQLWFSCLYSASNCLRSAIDSVLTLPLVRCDSASLGYYSRVDTNIAQKWDRKLQRLVFRGYVVTPVRVNDSINDYSALIKCLSQASVDVRHPLDIKEVDADHLESSVRRFHTKIRRRWVAA